MDNPPRIFGQSKKSNLKSSFSTSKKYVHFDEKHEAALQLELQAERRQKEEEEERIKQEQYKLDEFYMELNGIPPFVGITSPPPCDPHQYSAEHKRKSSFLSSSPSLKPSKFDQSTSSFFASNFGSHAAEREKMKNSFLSSSPPFNNSKGYRPHSKFASSRYGSIGDGRPTLNSPSSFSSSNSSANHFNMSHYKTALCRQYTQSKTCTYGDECRYAHGKNDLRLPATAHLNYKSVLCKYFITGECRNGSKCRYIHHLPSSFQSSSSEFASSLTQYSSFNH